MSNCLAYELKRLKGSSKEAVENLESFSDFKKYMHIKRNMQDELINIIEQAKGLNKKQLILVCGSVGDGKSHLISYIKNNTEMLDGFKLHNDATESFRPNQTSEETLDEVLIDFRDDNIDNGKDIKIVLAINLGTLNNFIDSTFGENYKKLKDYVKQSKIFDNFITNTKFEEDSYFQNINFSDYHLFSLTEEGNHIKSSYVSGLLDKITGDDSENEFFKAYKTHCTNCNLCGKCPVKHNFEMIKHDNVKKAIINVLVEVIIKDKIIISTRALLNFFYDIMVHNLFSYEKFNSISERDYVENYIDALMPNLLYKHGDLSYILNKIEQYDPLIVRKSGIDELIIKFNILEDIKPMFENYLMDNAYCEFLFSEDINKISKENKKLKSELLELLIRSYKIFGIEGKLDIEDEEFNSYVKNLYFFNKGKKMGLRYLYADVEQAIYRWNGKSEGKCVNLNIGKNQFVYKVAQEIEMKAYTNDLVEKPQSELDKFVPYIIAKFTDKGQQKVEEVNIDYSLYKLLISIKNGYRPNIKDKNQFIGFVNFMNRINNWGTKQEKLTFTEKNVDEPKTYILEQNDFGFIFEEI